MNPPDVVSIINHLDECRARLNSADDNPESLVKILSQVFEHPAVEQIREQLAFNLSSTEEKNAIVIKLNKITKRFFTDHRQVLEKHAFRNLNPPGDVQEIVFTDGGEWEGKVPRTKRSLSRGIKDYTPVSGGPYKKRVDLIAAADEQIRGRLGSDKEQLTSD